VKLGQVNSGAYAIGLISWAATVTKQYKFDTGVSWEGSISEMTYTVSNGTLNSTIPYLGR